MTNRKSQKTLAHVNSQADALAGLMRRLRASSSYRVLESRMVFDGAAVDTAAAAAEPRVPATPEAIHDTPGIVDVLKAAASAPVEPVAAVNTIVFIDGNVGDADVISAAVPAGAEIVMLDTSRDGLTQIADVLANRSGIDAIHIVSHGEQGQLYLGNSAVDLNSISGRHADELATIKSALSNDADILIYGCDVAAGESGRSFVNALSDATGADVAASIDGTGFADMGGDWDLEQSVGHIDVVSIQAVNWEHLLAPIAITNLNGTTITATTLADNIAGNGVTVISATYTGDNSQAGTFTGATGYPSEWLGYATGTIFSSGSTASVLGPNTVDNTTVDAPGTGTDADFTTIGGRASNDTSALSITFVPTGNRVTLQFTFASEEYNEYVYANFNDAVGVWVNGAHVSLTPMGAPIAIDTINQAATYNPASGNLANDPYPTNGVYDSSSPSLYLNNSPGAGTYNVAADGLTVTLTLVANVNVGVNNTIKLGVADIGDAQYDSWLFVKENSLQTTLIADLSPANSSRFG